jgi:hypothetical protein
MVNKGKVPGISSTIRCPGCSDGEAAGRRQSSLNRTRLECLRDAEFIAGMRARRVMGHQLIGDPLRELGLKSARCSGTGSGQG